MLLYSSSSKFIHKTADLTLTHILTPALSWILSKKDVSAKEKIQNNEALGENQPENKEKQRANAEHLARQLLGS